MNGLLPLLLVAAQQIAPPSTGGIVALDRMLGHLASNRRLLVIAAHPDDENSELLSLASRGLGVDAAYFSVSRGEGGQNLIGSELGEGLGLIRSGELLAARAIDGGRQYFARAFDFGFSKSLAETDRFWPRDTTLADLLRVIRRFKPQVLVAVFSGTPRDGHGQHQQSGALARRAFELLRDSAWGPKKLYRSAFFDTTQITLRLPSGIIDPAEGRSYVQLAVQSRSQHRSQDMGAIQRLGPSTVRLSLIASAAGGGVSSGPAPREEASLFEGVDTSLAPRLDRYAALIDSTRATLGPRSLDRVSELLLQALAELRRHADPAFLAAEEPLLQDAIVAASRIVVDPAADDGFVVPGQTLTVALSVWTAGSTRSRVVSAEIETPAGWRVGPAAAPAAPGQVSVGTPGGPLPPGAPGMDIRRFAVTVPTDATPTEPYFLVRPRVGALYDWSATPDTLRGEPFDPPALMARVTLEVAGVPVTVRREVSWRYADQAIGEIRKPVLVVPRVGVAVSPELLVWPVDARSERTVTIELTHGARGVTSGALQLEMPPGWPAVPPKRFTLEGEGTRRSFTFAVPAPQQLSPGSYGIHAVARIDETGTRESQGVVLISYPHIRPVQFTTEATIRVQAAPLALPALRRVGYVRGASDAVPEALQSIGLPLTVLSPADLERADLSAYDVIVVGSRAYEVDPALVANNGRLLDFARAGGRVIVLYQQYQFVRGGYAPFPLTIGQPHDRVTDETSPVRILEPAHALFQTPNAIGDADWEGWVQERGLYFARTWDPAYRPLLEMGDPPVSAASAQATAAELATRGGSAAVTPTGVQVPGREPRELLRGGLLVARLGRGLYVYTGIAFFRELPAGVPGAYRLFVNLLGLEPASVP